MSPVEPIDVDWLRQALKHQRIGHHIELLAKTTSTNDVVATMAAGNAEGLVVLAEGQTAGRGQYGRRWESAIGKGLWFSILLRPMIAVAESGRVTDFLAHAIAATIERELHLAATIKLPNDIYIEHRKVGGVLVEMRVESSGSYCAIAGIGINVNQELSDFPPELQATATSLGLASGRRINRTDFALALLRELDASYAAGQV